MRPIGIQAQTQAAQVGAAKSTTAAKSEHHRKRASAAHAKPTPATAEAAPPAAPPEPEIPKWPAFDRPTEATVVWDSHGLRIDAANSSLVQILKEVSTVTGVKMEGLNADQRVFGDYGPGQARDVLSQLLLGSGYNVIMIGDQGQGIPREVRFSPRQVEAPRPLPEMTQRRAETTKTTRPKSLRNLRMGQYDRGSCPVCPLAARSRSCRRCRSASVSSRSRNSHRRINESVLAMIYEIASACIRSLSTRILSRIDSVADFTDEPQESGWN